MKKVDVLLVGAGVMSATLGQLLLLLDPTLRIMMVERLSRVASESSHALNNAGTGHAGYCELNYTPQTDGSVDIGRALAINSAYEISLQFWSYLVENGMLPEPQKFINPICHQSFVWGEQNVEFLKKRFEALHAHHLFAEMEYSEDHEVLRQWMPLVMEGRDLHQRVAATQVKHGTDVDFGVLTRNLVKAMGRFESFELLLSHSVSGMKQHPDTNWHVRIMDNHTKQIKTVSAGFVFLGAGGGALPLLQKSGIPESSGYGGFPVSGQWLICKNPDVVNRHRSKVYGKAPMGAPPMSVPHLDARLIDSKPALLFGPFASITTKFLKEGSVLDLFSSLKSDNLKPMLSVARDNMDLTRYLITEAFRSHKERVASLKEFYADAREEDWELASAGQRVQIIKGCNVKGGRLEFGTEIVSAHDGTLAALLGASPGASVSVKAMLAVIERCFDSRMQESGWNEKLMKIIPSFGVSLDENPELLRMVRERNLSTLGLT